MSTIRDRTTLAKNSTMKLIEEIPALNPCGKVLTKLIVNSAKKKKMNPDELLTVLDGINLRDEEMERLYDVMGNLEIDICDDADEDAIDAKEAVESLQKQIESEHGISDDLDAETLYMREMAAYPMLSQEEEKELLQIIAAGAEAAKIKEQERSKGHILSPENPEDKELLRAIRRAAGAKDKMIVSNLRLVVSVALKFKTNGVSVLDLIQEGNLGLMHAIDKFSLQRNTKFSTYAVFWIRQTITRGVAAQSHDIRIPVHLHETLGKITKVQSELESKLGRPPTDKELADACGVPTSKIKYINKTAKQSVSLYSPIGQEQASSESTMLMDMISDDSGITPEEFATHRLLQTELGTYLKELPPREEKIIRVRFGLEDNQLHTLDEVGREFGLTRERVRQIIQDSLEKLRKSSGIQTMATFIR